MELAPGQVCLMNSNFSHAYSLLNPKFVLSLYTKHVRYILEQSWQPFFKI